MGALGAGASGEYETHVDGSDFQDCGHVAILLDDVALFGGTGEIGGKGHQLPRGKAARAAVKSLQLRMTDADERLTSKYRKLGDA